MIETKTTTKQMYRYKYNNYLLTTSASRYSHLYDFNVHCLSIKDINSAVKNKLNQDFNKIINVHNNYLALYSELERYELILNKNKDEKTKKSCELKIKELCEKLPIINKSVLILFTCIILVTDLQDVPIISPTVMQKSYDENTEDLFFSEDENE